MTSYETPPDPQPAAQSPAHSEPKGARPKWLIPAAAVAIGALLFGLGFIVGKGGFGGGGTSLDQVAAAGGPTVLEQSIDACGLTPSSTGITVGDDGYSLTLDNEPSALGLSMTKLLCVLNDLGVSDATMARMGETRALDGTLTADEGDLNLSWTYHPDNGLDVVVQLAQP